MLLISGPFKNKFCCQRFLRRCWISHSLFCSLSLYKLTFNSSTFFSNLSISLSTAPNSSITNCTCKEQRIKQISSTKLFAFVLVSYLRGQRRRNMRMRQERAMKSPMKSLVECLFTMQFSLQLQNLKKKGRLVIESLVCLPLSKYLKERISHFTLKIKFVLMIIWCWLH